MALVRFQSLARRNLFVIHSFPDMLSDVFSMVASSPVQAREARRTFFCEVSSEGRLLVREIVVWMRVTAVDMIGSVCMVMGESRRMGRMAEFGEAWFGALCSCTATSQLAGWVRGHECGGRLDGDIDCDATSG